MFIFICFRTKLKSGILITCLIINIASTSLYPLCVHFTMLRSFQNMSNSCLNDAGSGLNASAAQQPDNDIESTILILISLLQTLTGSFLNTLVLLLLGCNTRLFQLPSNIVLLSLVVSDLISCSLFLPYHIFILRSFCYSRVQHEAYQVAAAFCTTACVNNVLLMTLDRFLAVVYPLRYNGLSRSSRIHKAVLIVWCTTLCFTLVVYIDIKFNVVIVKYILLVFQFSSILLTSALYWKMFVSARNQIRKIHNTYGSSRVGEFKMIAKSAATSSRVVVLFLVSYVPVLVCLATVSRGSVKESKRMFSWTMSFLFWNSCANPLIYFVFSPKFRSTVRETVRRWSPRIHALLYRVRDF